MRKTQVKGPSDASPGEIAFRLPENFTEADGILVNWLRDVMDSDSPACPGSLGL